ncbi:MAG: class I adenylate cyclase [Gammaproteobacteria bacterium]
MPTQSEAMGGVLGRFESINRARLRRIREALRPEQVRFFDVLTLLFHVNRPGLPGYVSRETPAGIARFVPGPEAMDAALHLFRSAIEAGEAADPCELLGIYCLGSLGSIAHCRESDLDVWVCHEPGIEARRLAELNAKARVIEQWAQGLGLEVHVFLIDPERFRAGAHARLSAECSGNAQHYLLLDEFYRSSVVLGGVCPMWWRVPPSEEHRYAECVADLQALQPEMTGVDLGGLGEVPREEFAGAALWQLGKVIDAPYKSALKLLLLEAYAAEYPRPDLLAMRYKACIYGGAADTEALDPYWLLYRRVEEYLEGQADAPRLALARRCLYFKAQDAQRHLPSHVARVWRGRFIAGLSRQWGWSSEDTARLAERDRWGFDRASAEWREIVNSLRTSSRVLAEFARPLGGRSSVTAEEITALGRRLHAVFERRPGKFTLLGPGTRWGSVEEELCLHRYPDPAESWGLSRGAEVINRETLVRTGEAPGQLIAWAILNGLSASHTRWCVDARGEEKLPRSDLETMQGFIERGLARGAVNKPETTDLIAAPRLTSAVVVVRVERVPVGAERDRPEGEPTPWSRYRVALAELILVTSWGERLGLHFRGDTALMRCLCEYLAWPSRRADRVPIEVLVYGDAEADAAGLAGHFEQLMGEAVTAVRGGPGDACRYVLASGSGYSVLEARGETWHAEPVESHAALLRFLGHPLPVFTRTLVQQGTCGPLPLVLAENQSGVVQVFLAAMRERAWIFVLDEHGALFHADAEIDDGDAFLGRYRRFLHTVLARAPASAGAQPPVLFYTVGGAGDPDSLRRLSEGPQGREGAYLLRALGTPHPGAGRAFTLRCCGREFSEPAHGPLAYREAALHLLDAHGDAGVYPVDVSDIELSAACSGHDNEREDGPPPVIPLLQYKTTVEGRLNEALRRLRAER